ncbi:BMP family protein [Beijerinckia sp. L45]|uniref:BMP family protein n=1 Tax=Beijerinckia sp. L45 TaxID=1641855 RepID=UPI00131D13E8|nr:BMP family protein [Beijerinckia sp. L45]
MNKSLARRMLLVSAAALAVSGSAAPTFAADLPEVAGLFTGSVTQGSWDVGGYQAFEKMAKKYNFKPSHVEGASYEKAPALLRQLASRGVKMIICHSSGYAAAIQEVAPDFPNTQFVLYSYADSSHGLKNYTAWSVNWDEYGYVVGALGAGASKTHHIAIVAAEPIPSAKRSIEFMIKGAKSVDPKIQVDTVFTGSFTDVAKAKEITTGLIARGADFVIPSADAADAGIQQAADQETAMTMGEYTDEGAKFPNAIVSSTMLNYTMAYDQIGKMFTDHTLGDKVVPLDLAGKAWTLSTPFKHVDKAVETKTLAVIDAIATKKIDVEK